LTNRSKINQINPDDFLAEDSIFDSSAKVGIGFGTARHSARRFILK
jgi:hypothetical protein